MQIMFEPTIGEFVAVETDADGDAADGEHNPKYPHYLPTREQIAAEAAEIRKGWSKQELLRRAGYSEGRLPRWQPPGCKMPPRSSAIESN